MKDLGNPLTNLVGYPHYKKKPSYKKVVEAMIEGMAEYSGVAWAPEALEGGQNLMIRQCPGACGHVWKIRIKDRDVANWLVNEINIKRHDTSGRERHTEGDG